MSIFSNVLGRLLTRVIQRKEARSCGLNRLYHATVPGRLRKSLFGRYKDYWSSASEGREELDRRFWGGEGGFAHAQGTFAQAADQWRSRYSLFGDAVLERVESGLRVVELGCSAGQWPMRLGFRDLDLEYAGIDINQQSIQFATDFFRDYGHLRFRVGDIRQAEEIDRCDLVMVCQTLFFMDQDTVRGLMRRVPLGASMVILEPCNDDVLSSPASQVLRSDKSLGFSHNYGALLTESGLAVQREEQGPGNKWLVIGARPQ